MTSLTRFFVGTGAATRHSVAPKGLFQRLYVLQSIWRERRTLSSMDARLLRDIGLTSEAADREAKRASWDAPERWLQ